VIPSVKEVVTMTNATNDRRTETIGGVIGEMTGEMDIDHGINLLVEIEIGTGIGKGKGRVIIGSETTEVNDSDTHQASLSVR